MYMLHYSNFLVFRRKVACPSYQNHLYIQELQTQFNLQNLEILQIFRYSNYIIVRDIYFLFVNIYLNSLFFFTLDCFFPLFSISWSLFINDLSDNCFYLLTFSNLSTTIHIFPVLAALKFFPLRLLLHFYIYLLIPFFI